MTTVWSFRYLRYVIKGHNDLIPLVTYFHLVEGVVIGFHGVVEGQLDYELIRGYKLPCVEGSREIHI